MHLILWEFYVRPGSEAEFERAYGPRGSWARLFARSRDYDGTDLLRDLERRGHYVTIDRWSSRAAFEAFRARWEEPYQNLDRGCEALTLRETRLGEFESADRTGCSAPA